MLLLVPLFVAFLFACLPRVFGLRIVHAIALGSAVVPCWVVVSEFVSPYRGAGASFWPIALVVGGAYGFAAACFGTLYGSAFGFLFRAARDPVARDHRRLTRR